MPNDVNLNIDAQTLAQCLKSTTRFGETVYHNICTGGTNIIPWGSADWALVIILTTIGASFALLLLSFLFAILSDF